MTFHFSFCQHYLQCITGALLKIFLIGSSYALDKVLINLAFKELRSWVVNPWGDAMERMFPLYFPAKGVFQKLLLKRFQLCLLALGTLFFLVENLLAPSGICVGRSASPAGYQLGKGFATPSSPCGGGTCGWSPASGHSPASQQTELILSGLILQLLVPPCLNILVFNRSSSGCKNLVLWQTF